MHFPRGTLFPVLLLLVSCKTKGDDTGVEEDVNPADVAWEDGAVYGFANLDDDDEDGSSDWGSTASEEDDHFPLVLSADLGYEAPEGATLRIRTRGSVAKLNVWMDGDLLLTEDSTEADIDLPSDDLTLQVEFKSLRDGGRLEVEMLDADGEIVRDKEIALVSAPLILNHHMQPIERVFAMSGGGSQGNRDFIDGFEDVLDDDFESFSLSEYGWDVWIQDEIEMATLTAPDGRRMDLVIDSVRSPEGQYLGALPQGELEEPGVAVKTWGSGYVTSQDSFGNLEISPPVTVDGVSYPFGRAYYGEFGGDGPTDGIIDMLDKQAIQKPFTLDVTFLCVGHVDEYSTFIPDSTAPKGFRFYVADVGLAYEFLEDQPQGTSLPRFAADHGYDDIGEIVDDDELRALNEDIQADYIDPAIEIMKTELGLTEDDIVRIPGMFEVVRGCGGTTVGLIPGTANMTVAPMENGELHLFIPDPFLRSDSNDQDSDPFITEIERLLPAEATPHWLDDWDWYHIMLGEVHCGSNTFRTPIEDWWEAAVHLLDDVEG